jgi:hypothetical protein
VVVVPLTVYGRDDVTVHESFRRSPRTSASTKTMPPDIYRVVDAPSGAEPSNDLAQHVLGTIDGSMGRR